MAENYHALMKLQYVNVLPPLFHLDIFSQRVLRPVILYLQWLGLHAHGRHAPGTAVDHNCAIASKASAALLR